MSTPFPLLSSPLNIRGLRLKNRIVSTGHDTSMPTDGLVNPRLIAYHQARIDGGVGLIILQVSGVHESARYTNQLLMATHDDSIEGYRQLAERCHAQDCKIFAQLFHPGREIMEAGEGLLAVAYSASAQPSNRFHVMPKALSQKMIDDITDGYVAAALRMQQAGIDGVEFVASHGYLPAQFMNEHINQRTDPYGGSLDNRLRFSRDILTRIRAATNPDFVIGMRISADEKDDLGLGPSHVLAITTALAPQLDYLNLTLGTSASLGGAIHIAPPMAYASGYVQADIQTFKPHLDLPILVAGRINQAQDAEVILQKGLADLCGMTRALICDPELPNKAFQQRLDDIRACIGCNQACIGHFHKGQPISCIQYPQSGRELHHPRLIPTTNPKKIMVIGGGPAGMQAALVAAQRGHTVSLYEASATLGGQALLAQNLARRTEFGGLITNLKHALAKQPVAIHTQHPVDLAMVEALRPDVVILATGARPFAPQIEQDDSILRLDAWQYLQGTPAQGASVLVTDWRCDWIAPGIAEQLIQQGHQVHIVINGLCLGEQLPLYVRDDLSAVAHKLGINLIHNACLYGVQDGTVYLQHNTSGEAMMVNNIDTIIGCDGHEAVDDFGDALEAVVEKLYRIGDCLTPRTAEEAIYEGFKCAVDLP
ncbi:MAG: FAD-dependent oxidoreductase [Neisseriaceae bacterium]|nr:FAD-dependent oxidoreductase [Neisseriaceae bacterium]